ncbi:UNVERIFIED_CONTAM: hypothetical protein RMT77_002209 [Armadillidium vulgare]
MNFMSFVLILLGLFYSVSCQDCPCALQNSTKYPGTWKWNCQKLSLTEVPGECYEIQSINVTELILTDNQIPEIHNVDLAQLVDMKALYFDSNKMTYFDPSALTGINELEIFYGSNNPQLQLPKMTLINKPELKELVLTGSSILSLPNITSSTKLERVDIRSCGLITLSRPTFGDLQSDSNFLLTMMGNDIKDCAADILLPIPEQATINVDDYFLIWAADSAQKDEVLSKNWKINVDLASNLKICGTDGTPTDQTQC